MTENTFEGEIGDLIDPSIQKLVEQWKVDPLDELAFRTIKRYNSILEHFLIWFFRTQHRPLTLSDIHPITLVSYRNDLQISSSTNTVNIHLAALRTWCAWLYERKYLTINPALRLKLVRSQNPPAPRSLKSTEVNALLREAGLNRYAARNLAILQMLIQTGMRIGECAALCWEDITFSERQGQAIIRMGKGNKSRIVPLNGSVRLALAKYTAPLLKVEPTLREIAKAWPRLQSDRNLSPLWKSERHNRLSERELSRMINWLVRDCAAQGLVPPETTPHSLRHTFATHYLAKHGDDLVGLARLLGHSSLDATKIYVQPTAEEIMARVDRIDLNAYTH